MIKKLFSIWQEIYEFAKNPKDQGRSTDPISTKLLYLVSAYLLIVLFSIGYSLLFESIDFLKSLETGHKLYGMIESLPLFMLFLMGVIFIPFIEELIFRLGISLRDNYFLLLLIQSGRMFGEEKHAKLKDFIRTNWHKYFTWIFYSSALVFAAVHLTNFEITTIILLLSPFLILSQLFGAIVIGFLRVKQGFFWGFFLHALFNFTFLIVPLILFNDPEEKLSLENDEFSIKVYEMPIGTGGSSGYYKPSEDSVHVENYKITSLIESCLDTQSDFIDMRVGDIVEKKVDITMHIKNRNVDDKAVILEQLSKIYNFNVVPDSAWFDINFVEVWDQDKILKYRSKDDKPESSSFGLDHATVSNGSMNSLVYALNHFYKPIFELSNDSTPYTLNFTLRKVPEEELEPYLHENFGLSFKSFVTKKQVYKVIPSREDD